MAGLVGVVDAGRRARGRGLAIPNYALLIALILTWCFFGYDIYARSAPVYDAGIISTKKWAEEANHLIAVTGDLTNRTIPMDGYKFTDCQVGNSILIYQGKKPTGFSCKAYPALGSLTVESDNPVVRQTMEIMTGLSALARACSGALSCQAPNSQDFPLLPPP